MTLPTAGEVGAMAREATGRSGVKKESWPAACR
jgi:hypothetical protein